MLSAVTAGAVIKPSQSIFAGMKVSFAFFKHLIERKKTNIFRMRHKIMHTTKAAQLFSEACILHLSLQNFI